MSTLFEAAMGGYNAADQMIKEGRAYRAAREKYGEKASNPGLFSALEEMDLAKNRDSRAERQIKIQERAADRADRQESRTAQSHSIQTREAESGRDQAGLFSLVNGLRQARDSGQDLGAAFDQLVDKLPEFGVSEEDIPTLRQELLDNPAILDSYYEALGGDKAAGVKPMTQKQAQAKEAGSAALLKMQDIFQRIDLLESPEYEPAGQSVFGMPGVGGIFGHGGFGAFGAIPGSSAADFVANLTSLEGDIRSQAFETLKGGGQITEKESEFARDAIARLDRTTSYEEFQRELTRVRKYMTELMSAAERRLGGEAVPELAWGDDDTTGYNRNNATDTGQITTGFTDPYGNKLVGTDPNNPAHWQDKDGNPMSAE